MCFIQFLEKLDNHIIPHDYPSISSKAVDRIVREPLCFMDQEAKLEIPHIPGWTSTADQWTVSSIDAILSVGCTCITHLWLERVKLVV